MKYFAFDSISSVQNLHENIIISVGKVCICYRLSASIFPIALMVTDVSICVLQMSRRPVNSGWIHLVSSINRSLVGTQFRHAGLTEYEP
uniref:Uncharacterized protein n=1 Tax=Parascaris univalens TaxID=6257 RepID=A0A915BEI1_PARUN